jgi:hypothetical protein
VIWLVLGGMLLGVLLAFLEWRRPATRHLGWRIGAVAVAVLSLALLAGESLRPSARGPGGGAPRRLALDPPTEIGVGEPMILRGRVRLDSAGAGVVLLDDLTGHRDSMRVRGSEAPFRLTDRPRSAGLVRYRVRLRQGLNEVAADSFSVAVRDHRPPRLLVLDASPSFETRFLKRWLADRGGQLIVRTTITRGRVGVERLNGLAGDPSRLTPGLLESCDAVVLDGKSLTSLAPAERAALHHAVEAAGLGVLITPDVSPAISAHDPFLAGLRLSAGQTEYHTAQISWSGVPAPGGAAVELEAAGLEPGRNFETLAWKKTGATVAALSSFGEGSVAVTLVRTPSRWKMDGDPARFGSYWSLMLAAVARDTTTRVAISAAVRPTVNREVRVDLVTGSPTPEVAVLAPDGSADSLALARDPFTPRLWRGRYWPRVPGQHALRLAARDVPFLVAAPEPDSAVVVPEIADQWRRGLLFTALLTALTVLWLDRSRSAVGTPSGPT